MVRKAILTDKDGEHAVFVRINALITDFTAADIESVVIKGLNGVLLSKTETNTDITKVDGMLEQAEVKNDLDTGTIKIIPIVETAKGVINAYQIASASPRMLAVSFGAGDYYRDMGRSTSSISLGQVELLFARSQGWKHKRCSIHSYRINWLDDMVWDCVYALLKQPEWVEEELLKREANENIDELRKRIGIEHQRIDRTQAKIRRIQEGYEAAPPVYTTSEAEENIQVYRDLISQVEKEVYRLQDIMAQQTLNKKTKEEVCQVLDTIRDMNLENISFNDKQNLIAKLGIKVYPSKDKRIVRISSIIQPDPSSLNFSPQIISMASPKL